MYFYIVLSLLVGLVVNTGRTSVTDAKKTPRKRAPRSKTPPRKKKSAATASPAILKMITKLLDKVVETAVGSSEQSVKKKATKRTRPAPMRFNRTDDDAIQSILDDGKKKGLLLRYKVNKTSNDDGVTVQWRICSNMDFKLKYAIVDGSVLQPTWKREGSVFNPLREVDMDERSVWLKAQLTRIEVERWCSWTKTNISTVCHYVKTYRAPKREEPKREEPNKPRRRVVSHQIKKNRDRKKLVEEANKRYERDLLETLQNNVEWFVSLVISITLQYDEATVDDIGTIDETLSKYWNLPEFSEGFSLHRFSEEFRFFPNEMKKKEEALLGARKSVIELLQRLEGKKVTLLKERSLKRKQVAEAKRNEAKVRANRHTERETYTNKPPPLKKSVPVVPETYEQKVVREMEQRRLLGDKLKRKHGPKSPCAMLYAQLR